MYRDFILKYLILKIKCVSIKIIISGLFYLGLYFVIAFLGRVRSHFFFFQAVSIVGNEVFRFNLDLYPDATEGDSYTDMSTVDGVMALHVGCIQIVYLHKFLMSLLVKLPFICSHLTLEAISVTIAYVVNFEFWDILIMSAYVYI